MAYSSWRLWVHESELPLGWAKAYPSPDVQGRAIDLEYDRIPQQIKAEYSCLLETLRPLPILLHQADSLVQEPCVSVHYRDGADWDAWGRSISITQFWPVMDAFPANTRFFVSTHTLASLNIMRERYGNRIIHNEGKEYTGPSGKRIQDALVDLLCLAKGSTLIGTYGSTFTEMAWWFGRCEQTVQIVGSRSPQWRVF